MNSSVSKNEYVISTGDPAGCAPGLIPPLIKQLSSTERLLIVGPSSVQRTVHDSLRNNDAVEWIEAGQVTDEIVMSGRSGPESGEAAWDSLNRAVQLCEEREEVSGLLTLPLNKYAVQEAGQPDFRGHTEFLETYIDCRGVMSFFGENMNVALLTRHIPLSDVPAEVSETTILKQVRLIHDFFQSYTDNDHPRLALLGLNPHAGERGLIGREDDEILRPTVEQLRDEGIDIKGPYPADSFLPVHGSEVDMVLACYHDQGLVPFKQEHFYSGVHTTMGLPVLRVSPVHGTAEDIVHSGGEIDPGSAINALKYLRRWAR